MDAVESGRPTWVGKKWIETGDGPWSSTAERTASAIAKARAEGVAAGRQMGKAEAFAEAQEYCHGYFNYPELTTWLEEREVSTLSEHVGAADKERGDV